MEIYKLWKYTLSVQLLIKNKLLAVLLLTIKYGESESALKFGRIRTAPERITNFQRKNNTTVFKYFKVLVNYFNVLDFVY